MLTEVKTDSHHYFVDEKWMFQGEYKSYCDNGQLYVHTCHADDKIHGEYKSYFRNGVMWEHVLYQNGVEHGEFKSYHGNGQLNKHAFYQNGILHGEYRKYHNNGDNYVTTIYYQGKNLNINPDTLTKQDKLYIMLCGRLPPKEPSC